MSVVYFSMDIASVRSEITGASECTGDFLRVIDGKCADSTQQKPMFTKLCGAELPGYIVSTGNHLCLKFVTDQSGAGKGFSAVYESVDQEKKSSVISPSTGLCLCLIFVNFLF